MIKLNPLSLHLLNQSLPKLVEFSELNILGVINITPNSFSDPKKYLDKQTLHAAILKFYKIPNLIFDFGFESTAPMNSAISVKEEKARFDNLFDQLKDVDLSGKWISFDTYKIENFSYFESQFKNRYQDCGFILNDVSGVIDDDLIAFLKTKINQDNFFYIYNGTHIPDRSLVLNHKNYISNEEIIKASLQHFTKGFAVFKELGIHPKIIFDPGFGFSKSYEQNWKLLENFDELVHKLENLGIDVPWVIGVSKKSFLRQSIPESLDPFADSEILHTKIIKNLLVKKLGHLLFRVHDPDSVVQNLLFSN